MFTIEDYRCFRGSLQIDTTPTITVLVGRNNTGKSSYLNVFELAKTGSNDHRIVQQLNLTSTRAAQLIVVPPDQPDARLPLLVGTNVKLVRDKGQQLSLLVNETPTEKCNPSFRVHEDRLKTIQLPLSEATISRISSERMVKPEAQSNSDLTPRPSGENVTRLINHFLHTFAIDESRVKETLLEALNEIVAPDTVFTAINTKSTGDGWEIVLSESMKQNIRLSESGSGLQTIIFVLTTLILQPAYSNVPIDNYVYLYEELENNLHPGLQWRLFRFIDKFATESGCKVILNTHSSVALDYFSRHLGRVRLLTTHQDGANVTVIPVATKAKFTDFLDEMGIRPSQVLQTNFVIWVEGPSDRVYLEHFLRIAGSQLQEGAEYQYLFYGGKILSHYSTESSTEHIGILDINRRCALVMDSDRSSQDGPLNLTKQRIIDEFTVANLPLHITAGKEIENYVPPTLMRDTLGVSGKDDIGQFEGINAYSARAGGGSTVEKMAVARSVCLKLTSLDELSYADDLKSFLALLRAQIKVANGGSSAEA